MAPLKKYCVLLSSSEPAKISMLIGPVLVPFEPSGFSRPRPRSSAFAWATPTL
jgi:hypothetical protein